jgi:hypothetical protein
LLIPSYPPRAQVKKEDAQKIFSDYIAEDAKHRLKLHHLDVDEKKLRAILFGKNTSIIGRPGRDLFDDLISRVTKYLDDEGFFRLYAPV